MQSRQRNEVTSNSEVTGNPYHYNYSVMYNKYNSKLVNVKIRLSHKSVF